MNTCRVNYELLAAQYDPGRALSEANEELWLKVFEQQLGLNRASRVLDVGCGTGRFSIAIARHFQCPVVGIDPSPSMLAIAKQKSPNQIVWLLGRAEEIPFSNDSFDACLASQVVHHFQDRQRAFNEIYRVLHESGRVGIRYSSHAQLSAFLDYRFFPSALHRDFNRVPDLPIVRELMSKAGFRTIEERVLRQQFFESSVDYLAKLRNKYSSVLTLISEEEYQKGLEEATRYFARHELKTSDKMAEISFIVGVK
jgi:ubiquinone/menaquinone biosynthesis C-methylase UbiE